PLDQRPRVEPAEEKWRIEKLSGLRRGKNGGSAAGTQPRRNAPLRRNVELQCRRSLGELRRVEKKVRAVDEGTVEARVRLPRPSRIVARPLDVHAISDDAAAAGLGDAPERAVLPSPAS